MLATAPPGPLSILVIMLQKHIIRNIVQSALEEDVGATDITTTAALTGEETGKAVASLNLLLLWRALMSLEKPFFSSIRA